MRAARLEQVQRPLGVDAEIGEWLARRPVVRGLCRCVDNCRDRRPVTREHLGDASGVPDVDVDVLVVLSVSSFELGALPGGGRLVTEEAPPHVVVEPHYVIAARNERIHGFRTDESRGAGHQGHSHPHSLRARP